MFTISERKKMKCKQAIRAISPWQDGELGLEKAERLNEHLLSCPSCRESARTQAQLKDFLLSSPAPDWPLGLETRIMHGLKKVGPERPRLVPALVYSFIFALFFFLTFLLYETGNGRSEEVESISTVLASTRQMSLISVQNDSFVLFSIPDQP